MMEKEKKEGRYQRLYEQIEGLLKKSPSQLARMATVNAVLHHKMEYFFWTGFYLLNKGELTVGPYQGPPACQVLEKDKGVCWAAINENRAIVVHDVHEFPGHIACDSRSSSEIALPVRSRDKQQVIGVFDIDSKDKGSFDEVDRKWLEMIVEMIEE